jgi:hypothetical protein
LGGLDARLRWQPHKLQNPATTQIQRNRNFITRGANLHAVPHPERAGTKKDRFHHGSGLFIEMIRSA